MPLPNCTCNLLSPLLRLTRLILFPDFTIILLALLLCLLYPSSQIPLLAQRHSRENLKDAVSDLTLGGGFCLGGLSGGGGYAALKVNLDPEKKRSSTMLVLTSSANPTGASLAAARKPPNKENFLKFQKREAFDLEYEMERKKARGNF